MHTFIDNPLLITQLDAVMRLFLAALFGALLGMERSIAGKHAGMRTYALVSLGSALFVLSGILQELTSWSGSLDPSRIAAAVIMGIGFIGSGLAFLRAGTQEGDHPGELTTAAGIWVAAGVGIATGFGFYVLAVAATVIALLTFTVLMRVEHAAQKRYGKNTQ